MGPIGPYRPMERLWNRAGPGPIWVGPFGPIRVGPLGPIGPARLAH